MFIFYNYPDAGNYTFLIFSSPRNHCWIICHCWPTHFLNTYMYWQRIHIFHCWTKVLVKNKDRQEKSWATQASELIQCRQAIPGCIEVGGLDKLGHFTDTIGNDPHYLRQCDQEPLSRLMPHVRPINRCPTKNFNGSHFNALIIGLQPFLFTRLMKSKLLGFSRQFQREVWLLMLSNPK